MNTRPTEFRTPSDLQAQAARRAAEAAREARFRRLPTPRQPEPANFCSAYDQWEPVPRRLIWMLRITFVLALTLATAVLGMAVVP